MQTQRTLIMFAGLVLAAGVAWAQPQVAPFEFNPPIGTPTYASGAGPRVAIDSGHGNLHTVDGGYRAFADLLRRDGYRVSGIGGPITAEALAEVDILVVVNATTPRTAPPGSDPSVFTDAEIAVIDGWIRDGHALLLVADHEPWPAAVATLASKFRVEFANAYAYEGAEGSITYTKKAGSLRPHVVTEGVNAVATFLGSAFRVEGAHAPLLMLDKSAVARPILSTQAQVGDTPIPGWLQGALIEHGKGRVAVFGEAAALTAQNRGGRAMGMNAPGAEDNPRFVLNVVRWLGGR
jgi:hypothetical protein